MRLSDYVRNFEDWFNGMLDDLFTVDYSNDDDDYEEPSTKIVIVLEDGLFSSCYSNNPTIEVSVHHLDDDDGEVETFYRECRLKEDILPCPYPIVVKEHGGPPDDYLPD